MDKLNFYQQGAKIGLQQDKYSMAPWFIEGKNLDIFWSSQSVKASARGSEEVVTDEIVDTDERGRFSYVKIDLFGTMKEIGSLSGIITIIGL